jgi:hypothetical protein
MSRDKPRRLDAILVKQLEQAGAADFACKHAAANVARRVFASVRAEPEQ